MDEFDQVGAAATSTLMSQYQVGTDLARSGVLDTMHPGHRAAITQAAREADEAAGAAFAHVVRILDTKPKHDPSFEVNRATADARSKLMNLGTLLENAKVPAKGRQIRQLADSLRADNLIPEVAGT